MDFLVNLLKPFLPFFGNRLAEKYFVWRAARKLRDKDVTAALGLFIKAERSWCLNAGHPTPKSYVKDFQRYGRLLSSIASCVPAEGDVPAHVEMAEHAKNLVEICGNSDNHQFGTFGSNFSGSGNKKFSAEFEAFSSARGALQHILYKLSKAASEPAATAPGPEVPRA